MVLMSTKIKPESCLITEQSDRAFNRALITGVSGFVGRHLVEFLKKEQPEIEIHGLVRYRSNVEKLEGINLHYGDLNDFSSLLCLLEEVRPDCIFHLAASSYVDQSFIAPADTLHTNIIGTCNLLEAVKCLKLDLGYDPTIAVISSSEVYGQVKQDELPITEFNPFRPASPYAVSKVGEDMLAFLYHTAWGLKTLRSRAFSHSGTGRTEVFCLSSFAKQIAEIEIGKREFVSVGNLDSVRTLCDVRDMVRAYWLMITKCTYGEVYNIGGNEHMTVGDALNILISMSYKQIKVKVDPKRLRPADVTLQLPDSSKFREKTGWKPEYSAKEMLESILNFWRSKI